MKSKEDKQIKGVIDQELDKSVFVTRGRMDIAFFAMIMILLAVGLVMLFSASYAYAYYNEGSSYVFIAKQLKFAIAGVAIMILVSYFDYRWIAKLKLPWILYILSVVMLTLVLFMPGLGKGGVKRWIDLKVFSFQPSEIAKLSIIILFAYLISKYYKHMQKFTFGVLWMGFLLAVICGLVVAEPHLSATVLIFVIGFTLLAVGGVKKRYVIGALLAGVSAFAVIAFTNIVPYASSRLEFWKDPWADQTGKGYQTIQSMLAIGSGGLFGRGLGQSRQKYLWVPEPQNDFIFSIVCEELGLIGAAAILIAFGYFVWRGIKIAMNAPDRFGSLLALGIVFQVGLQAALNIFVVTNIAPNTGISLPFFSYGGTSILMLLFQMGIVLSISRSSSVQKR